jgi:hypothetical protein
MKKEGHSMKREHWQYATCKRTDGHCKQGDGNSKEECNENARNNRNEDANGLKVNNGRLSKFEDMSRQTPPIEKMN